MKNNKKNISRVNFHLRSKFNDKIICFFEKKKMLTLYVHI